jgi:hypothetical protein
MAKNERKLIREWIDRHKDDDLRREPVIGALHYCPPPSPNEKAFYVGYVVVGARRILIRVRFNKAKIMPKEADYVIAKIASERAFPRAKPREKNRSRPTWQSFIA